MTRILLVERYWRNPIGGEILADILVSLTANQIAVTIGDDVTHLYQPITGRYHWLH